MYNPLSRDSFGVSPAKRRARVGNKLGGLVRKYVESPTLLATVNSQTGGGLGLFRGGLLLNPARAPKAYRVSTVPEGRIIRNRLRALRTLRSPGG